MKNVFLLVVLLFSQISFSQVVDKSVTVENPDTTGKTSVAQLTDQANRKLAEDLILEFVGAEAYNRNKAALNTKVIQNALKFIPSQKALEPECGSFGVRLTIQYKVSLTDFRKLLADAGTFSKTRLAQHVVGKITITAKQLNGCVNGMMILKKFSKKLGTLTIKT
jgi:hypothetical protein